jgi:hypothetical protein
MIFYIAHLIGIASKQCRVGSKNGRVADVLPVSARNGKLFEGIGLVAFEKEARAAALVEGPGFITKANGFWGLRNLRG